MTSTEHSTRADMLAHFQCAVMHALLQYEVSLGDEVVFDLVTHVTHGREIQVERGVVVAGEFGDLTHRDLLDRLGLVQLPERLLEALDRLLRKLRVLLDCDSGLRTFSWRPNGRIFVCSVLRNESVRWSCISPRR